MKKSIVYQTINLVNNKIYVGVHTQENIDIFDGYLGCGFNINHKFYIDHPKVPLHFEIKKYGVKNFRRIILAVFDSYEDAVKLKKQIVNDSFVKRNDTYNISTDEMDEISPISQITADGTLIYTWGNASMAAETLGISYKNIIDAKLHKESCLEYFWSESPSINIKEYNSKKGMHIYQYSDTRKFIQVFESIEDAAKAMDSDEKTIYKAAKSEEKFKDFYLSFKCVAELAPKKLKRLKGKMLYIYDLQGKYITELIMGKEVYDFYQTKKYGQIRRALVNERPFKNTQLSLVKVESMTPASEKNQFTPRKVGAYSLDGNLVEEFRSVKDATTKYGTGVKRVLKGIQEKTKDLVFKYLD